MSDVCFHQLLCFSILKKKAVSTSHCAQPNTIEYDMALEWCLLQERSNRWWNSLHEVKIYPFCFSFICKDIVRLIRAKAFPKHFEVKLNL